MFRKCLTSLVISLFLLTLPAQAQQEIKELTTGYYMTVAAYLATGEGYASRYVKKLKDQGFSAAYGFTYAKNMYFVYIKRFDTKQAGVSEINSTRKNTPFDDTWVYGYTAINPQKETVAATPNSNQREDGAKEADSNANAADSSAMVEVRIKPKDEEINPPKEEVIDHSKLIYFESVEARTQDPVNVEVTLFDPYTKNVITTLKSRDTKRIAPPTNKNNIIWVKNNSIGWKSDEVGFNFNTPVTDSTSYFLKNDGDTLILFFDMHRLHKGDKQTLYNVYFITDAALMRPESELQLEELLDMMKANLKYKIVLHGHTNGTASGSYLKLREGSTNFFSATGNHENASGSAKKLSYDRADVVKQYLVSKGIDENRIDVIGHGGKNMIYDENSIAAKRNIRVEVEVVEE